MISTLKGRAAGLALVMTLAAASFPAGAAALPDAHGHVVHTLTPGARANANESSNWFGYNQGTLEQAAL